MGISVVWVLNLRLKPFGSESCPKCCAFWLLAFTFPLPKALLDRRAMTSRDRSKVGVASGTAFCTGPENTFFQICRFCMLFEELLAQLTLKCRQMCFFWTSRLTSCRNLVSFSEPLFLNDTTVFWQYFPMLAEPGIRKTYHENT